MITRVVMHPTAGAFTSVMPAHCSACALGDDGGIIGNAFTCAVDKVDRRPWEECPTPEQFVEITTPLTERYPLYDAKIFRSNDRFLGKLMMKGVEEGKYEAAEIPGIGTAIFSCSGPTPVRLDEDNAYAIKPKALPKDGAA
jgi:hypothetical protein